MDTNSYRICWGQGEKAHFPMFISKSPSQESSVFLKSDQAAAATVWSNSESAPLDGVKKYMNSTWSMFWNQLNVIMFKQTTDGDVPCDLPLHSLTCSVRNFFYFLLHPDCWEHNYRKLVLKRGREHQWDVNKISYSAFKIGAANKNNFLLCAIKGWLHKRRDDVMPLYIMLLDSHCFNSSLTHLDTIDFLPK